MCFYLDEFSTVWDATYPLAKRAHSCEECGREIQPGEYYERVGSLFDGHWETLKTCFDCLRLREAVREWELKEGCTRAAANCPYGYLMQHLHGQQHDYGDGLSEEAALWVFERALELTLEDVYPKAWI